MAVPNGIAMCNTALKAHPKKPKTYVFSGIEGDANHSFGYHLPPNELPGSDYSLQKTLDKKGAKKYPNFASAWDLSLGPLDMKTVTNRLLAASKRKDPRMKVVSEFCGTLNGNDTYPWDVTSNTSEGINTWDDSHLWHVHISIIRYYCDDFAALRGLVDVICGVPTVEEFTMNAAEAKQIQSMIDKSNAEILSHFSEMYKQMMWNMEFLTVGHDNKKHHSEVLAAAGAQNITIAEAQDQWSGHSDTFKASTAKPPVKKAAKKAPAKKSTARKN